MSNETALMRQTQIDASQLGARLFRQQTGMGWIGKGLDGKSAQPARSVKQITIYPGDVVIRKARPFHAGFTGLSDLGGWTPVEIKPAHVGETLAVTLQVETKDDAITTKAQLRWIEAVNRAGGIAGVVRSYDDLARLVATKSRSNY